MIIRQFKTANFTVRVESEPDYDSPTHLMDEELASQVMEDLHAGRLEHFCVKASVLHHGNELAHDYLGGCLYESPREFMDHRGMNQKGHGSYFSDMVRTVCEEARKVLSGMKQVHVRC